MKITWALNSATIMNCNWEQELLLWEQFKWSAAEIWFSKVEERVGRGATYEQLSRQMRDAGVVPVGLCAAGMAPAAGTSDRSQEYSDLEKRLDVAAAMGAPSLTIYIDGKVGDNLTQEYAALIEPLRKAADLAQQRKVKINLEFLGGWPINGTLGSCIELVNRVDHPALGMLFDFCHYYASASHLEELPLLQPSKLFMVHVDDSQRLPMEVLRQDQRCIPGQGRIPILHLMKYLVHDYQYDGYFSVELYDPEIWKLDPELVLSQLSAALVQVEEGMA